MNKELEEAKQRLELDIKFPLTCGDVTVVIIDDLETVLNYIDNSISKEIIEEKIEEVEYRLNETMITEKDMHYNLGKHAVLQELMEEK